MDTREKNMPDGDAGETDVRKSADWNPAFILGNIVSVLVSGVVAYAVMVLSEGPLYDKATDEGISSIFFMVSFVIAFVACNRIARWITRR